MCDSQKELGEKKETVDLMLTAIKQRIVAVNSFSGWKGSGKERVLLKLDETLGKSNGDS